MDEYTLTGMFYTAFQTALLACIRYWLYQDNLRISARRMYLILLVLSVGGTGLWVAAGGMEGVPFSSFRAILAVAMYLLSCFIIKEPFAKHTYVYSFIMVYDSAIEISASYVQAQFMPGARSWVFVLTAALLVAVTFVPAVRYLKQMILRLSAPGNDKLWGWLCVISFSFVFMNLLFTYPVTGSPSLTDLLSRYLMLFGIVGLYAATTRAVETMREAAETKAALSLTQRRVAMQQSHYDRMNAQMEQLRRERHDLRHHRTVLSALAKSGDMAALSEYLDAMATTEEAAPVTGNLAADSLLLYYSDAAKALGVQIESNLAIGRETPLSDPDLCVILGNLLENAVEAQRLVPQEKRFLRIVAKGGRDSLTLAVDNRFDGALLCGEDGAYLSRKEEEGHGLGLASVRAVCDKYGGVLQIETRGDLFLAGVVIGL